MSKTYIRKENRFYFWLFIVMAYINVFNAIMAPFCFKIIFIVFTMFFFGLAVGSFIYSERFKKGVNVVYV